MKRPGLFVATAGSLLLTALTLQQAGWLTPHAAGHVASPRPSAPVAEVKTSDPVLSDAAWRWRAGQPQHWRDCLLQR
jgi:hypothetical protein